MNSFLNDSFKNSSGLYERDINTSPLNTKKHSIINIEDQRAGVNIGISYFFISLETVSNPKVRSISHKRSIVKSKLPSLQQGSSKKIHNKSSIDNNAYKNNFSWLKAKSNLRQRQIGTIVPNPRNKNNSAPRGTKITTVKLVFNLCSL